MAELLFVAAAAAVGLYFAFAYVGSNLALFETGRSAIALLRTGTLADPYAVATGPTAHVPALTVLKLAVVFLLFGENTPDARLVLSIASVAYFCVGMWLVFRICEHYAIVAPARAFVLCVCLATAWQLYHCVVLYRQVDQPAGAMLLVSGWFAYTRARSAYSRRSLVALAALSGVAVLLSPSVFLALLLASLVVIAALPSPERVRAALLYAGVVALFVVPWVARNQIELGSPILLRSNFGLELWFGNAPTSNGLTWVGEHWLLHPSASEAEALRARAMGEVAYIAEMRDRAVAVILADPLRFIAMSLRRAWYVLAYVPLPDWSWSPGFPRALLQASAAGFGLLKVASLATILATRRRWLATLIFFVAPLAPFMLTHVYLRYTFVSYFASIVVVGIAADIASRAIATAVRSAARRDAAG